MFPDAGKMGPLLPGRPTSNRQDHGVRSCGVSKPSPGRPAGRELAVLDTRVALADRQPRATRHSFSQWSINATVSGNIAG